MYNYVKQDKVDLSTDNYSHEGGELAGSTLHKKVKSLCLNHDAQLEMLLWFPHPRYTALSTAITFCFVENALGDPLLSLTTQQGLWHQCL